MLPVAYDRRKAVLFTRSSGATVPPGATRLEDAAHDPERTPTVLVHGTNGRASTDWFSLAALLANAGVPTFAFTWRRHRPDSGGPTATDVHASDLVEFLQGVASATGSSRVDLVGHSWGAVIARHVARQDPRQRAEADGTSPWSVRNLVGLAPTYAGTTLHGLARLADHSRAAGARRWLDDRLPSWREQLAGSEVVTSLQDARLADHDAEVTYTTIVTRYDQVVTPFRAAFRAEPRARQIVVQDTCRTDFSDHIAITHDAVALWHVLRVLAPHAAGARPRGVVLPVIGGPLPRRRRSR